jgi:3-oxoacyl-[acyl-carrier-protein] synthase II
MRRRVVVTGLGAVTPIGNTVDEFWDGIGKGKLGISEITKFETSNYKVKLAAEVKDFDATKRMDIKSARRMERFAQFAVYAAKEAMDDAGIDMGIEDKFRVGVAVGSGVGSLQIVEKACEILDERGPAKLTPLMIPLMIPNMAAGNISIQLGAGGKSINISTACATGTHNIGEAFRSIQYGETDVMITGGAESCITPTCVGGFTALTALSLSADPARASIPFDKERNGFVIGEGAGIVILEEMEHAKQRGAKIYAELIGYASTSDAHHITSPPKDGECAAKAMALALQDANIESDSVDYINAHGTSTHQNDLTETLAIKSVFGVASKKLMINSTKSMIGHCLGAAGGIEFIVCVKTIADGFIHQTIGTKMSDAECDLNYTIGQAVKKPVHIALSNSFAFGGHNATLILKEYTE